MSVTTPIDLAEAAAQPRSGSAIVFDDVHIAFGENQVLRGVSFQLAFGETKALFGVAGAGKSTILKLALGLFPPDSGRITVLANRFALLSAWLSIYSFAGALGNCKTAEFDAALVFQPGLPVLEVRTAAPLARLIDGAWTLSRTHSRRWPRLVIGPLLVRFVLLWSLDSLHPS